MAIVDPQTVQAFDSDIEEIRALAAQTASIAKSALSRSIDALIADDEASAAQVGAGDAAIDRLSREVERQCIRLLELRSPVADDLRETLVAFKQAIIIERMGNGSRNIAQQLPLVLGATPGRSKTLPRRMSAIAQDLAWPALSCVIERDPDAVRAISASLDLLSSFHDELLRERLDGMADAPSTTSASICLLLASQKIVRLGEHSANLIRVAHLAAPGTQITLVPIEIGEERS